MTGAFYGVLSARVTRHLSAWKIKFSRPVRIGAARAARSADSTDGITPVRAVPAIRALSAIAPVTAGSGMY